MIIHNVISHPKTKRPFIDCNRKHRTHRKVQSPRCIVLNTDSTSTITGLYMTVLKGVSHQVYSGTIAVLLFNRGNLRGDIL